MNNKLPQTGKLRELRNLSLAHYAISGDRQALDDAEWANRMLKKIAEEREQEQEVKEQ